MPNILSFKEKEDDLEAHSPQDPYIINSYSLFILYLKFYIYILSVLLIEFQFDNKKGLSNNWPTFAQLISLAQSAIEAEGLGLM